MAGINLYVLLQSDSGLHLMGKRRVIIMDTKNILVVDEDADIRQSLITFLNERNYNAVAAASCGEAIELLHKDTYQLLITEMQLPDGDAYHLIDLLAEYYPYTVTIVMSRFVSTEAAIKAVKRGACGYLAKPLFLDELSFNIEKALVYQSITAEDLSEKYGINCSF